MTKLKIHVHLDCETSLYMYVHTHLVYKQATYLSRYAWLGFVAEDVFAVSGL